MTRVYTEAREMERRALADTEASAWERRMLGLRMKQCGMGPVEVARRLGVSPYLAKAYVERAEVDIQTTLGAVHPDYRPISMKLFKQLEDEVQDLGRQRKADLENKLRRIKTLKREITEAIRTLRRHGVYVGRKTLDTARAVMAAR